MLILNTVKLVLIALNILPYRFTHRKVLFMIYLATLVTHVMMDEPRFAQPIPNVTVAVGRDANLPCVVEHLGTYKVAWIHIDRQMILTIHRHVISRIPRYSITYDNANTWLLHVSQAQQDDRGYYMCQVNTNPMISQVGYLQVVVPPNILDIESTPSSVAVRENQNINMTCRADGFPAPKIIWRREDGEAITVEKKKKGKVMVYDGEVLPLAKVSRNEMGAYLCIATNGVPPSVSKRIILDVEFSPMIWVPNQLVGAPAGTDVTIDCHTEAHPKAIIYWVYNSVMVLPSKKFKTEYTENSYRAHMKLTIKNLQSGDFGNYRCISKNSLGETEGSIRVYGALFGQCILVLNFGNMKHFVVVLVILNIWPINCKMVNHMKAYKVECNFSEKYIVNGSCTLKPLNRRSSAFNLYAGLIKPIDSFTISAKVFRRYNTFVPFPINLKVNMCEYLSGQKKSTLFSIAKGIMDRYTNVNHSCPYSGAFIAKNVEYDPRLLEKFTSLIPQGTYRVDIHTFQDIEANCIALGQAYIEITEENSHI